MLCFFLFTSFNKSARVGLLVSSLAYTNSMHVSIKLGKLLLLATVAVAVLLVFTTLLPYGLWKETSGYTEPSSHPETFN